MQKGNENNIKSFPKVVIGDDNKKYNSHSKRDLESHLVAVNGEIPDQVRDDGRKGQKQTLKQVQGDAFFIQHDGTLGVRDDSKKYNSHSKLDLESHRFFDNSGFTLIELLVVVLIIGILASVALPQYQKAVAKAQFTQILTASKSITEAEQRFFLANGEYTLDPTLLDIEFPPYQDTQTG